MKTLAALLFLLAFLAHSFDRSLIAFDYTMNTAAYAKNCINKSRPAMHCNGRCQLMKKLREEEQKEQDSNSNKARYKQLVLSSRSFFPEIPVSMPVLSMMIGSDPAGQLSARSAELLRPPRFC